MLKFSKANVKTKALHQLPEMVKWLRDNTHKAGRKVYSLDLPAGKTCPGAKDCKSCVMPRDDDPTRFHLVDGPECEFRCFAASQEVLFPNVRKSREHNLGELKGKSVAKIRDRILADMPKNTGVVRVHVSGDFFSLYYFRGLLAAAKARPDVLFYFYTKSLPFLVGVELPDNVLATVSRGGKFDHLIGELGIREAVVVHSEEEAAILGLEIDHDDSHAATPGGSFALLIHGTQPKGSEAGVALRKLKGKGSYARK